jgi:NAD(P)-dependent dehydrogenase (short-subunit alcohol dehydrogenase family)
MSSITGTVLITGAASGIGRACAIAANDAGADKLILVDTNSDGLEDTASLCGGAAVSTHVMSVANSESWAVLEADVPNLSHGIICAGISDAAMITDMTFEAWRKVMSVNLDGAFLSLQTMLLKITDGGSIVAVGSATGSKAVPMTAAYGASKAGLAQLVRVAALEAAPRKIRVNAIAPGGVKTPMFSEVDWFATLEKDNGGTEGAWQALAAQTPLGEFAEPEDIARMVLFLLGDGAGPMTGAVLDCSGGYVL